MQQAFSPVLSIISINTDEPSGIAAACKVLSEHPLSWPSVMSGKGLSDPVWMMFRSMEDQGLPFYVLVGPDGVIRYSSGGGERLADLRAAIQKLVPRAK